ncbi:peptidoglycan-binding protein, partial [Streptomyces gardneri]|uniref:peptidoglycan-binding protein n=1 Tax=Streptomyces gardneri TaxID=66892 RepID=UPI003680440D
MTRDRSAAPGPHEPNRMTPNGTTRRRFWVLAVAGTAVLVSIGGVLAAGTHKSPAQAAADARPPRADVLTAPVEHRVLVSSVITRGQVKATQSLKVKPQVTGAEGSVAPVVTRLPLRQGEAVSHGAVLVEVSGRPVIALQGTLPSYRDLAPGATGADVQQLQHALGLLGHATDGDPKGTFGAATQSALSALYADRGYQALPAREDAGTALKAARESVRQAQRNWEDANRAARSKPGNSTATSGTEGGTDGGREDPGTAVRRAGEDLETARNELAETEAATGPKLPAGEVVYLTGFPGRLDSLRGGVGSEAAETSLTVSAGKLLVQSYVPDYQKGLLRRGQRVEIYSETTGVTATAQVSSVASEPVVPAQPGDEEGSGPENTGYLVQVVPDKPLDERLTGQDVRLIIEAASTGSKALVVPITALSSGSDGRTTVTVADPAGDRRRVEVRPGTAGDGYVAVTAVDGGKLAAGDLVVTGVGRTPTAVTTAAGAPPKHGAGATRTGGGTPR